MTVLARSGGLRREQTSWVGLAALALFLGFAYQGTRGLWDPDEGRLAQVASEMLANGDLVTPRLGGQPHFTKPPLTYWCIAASISAFGRNEWAVRLFLSLAYASAVMVVAAFGARLWDRRTGLWTGLIYATSLTPFVGANVATPDTLLVLWEAIALYASWRGFTAERRGGRWGWPALTGAAFGLAFLTKGPPGLIFLPAMLIFRMTKAGRRRGSAPVLNLTGLALFAVIGLSWYLIVIRGNPGLLDYFLGSEVIGRVAGHHHRNPQWYGPLVIYSPVLVAGSLPWCVLWPRLWRQARAAAGEQGIPAAIRTRPPWLLLALSFLLPLVIFCAVRSRLPLYVLPLFVPLAAATARGLIQLHSSPASSPPGSWMPWLALWIVVLLAGRLGLAFWPSDQDSRRLYRSLAPPSHVVVVVIDEGRPHFGLSFYARSDLELVTWSKASPSTVGLPARQSIEEEIAEASHPGGRPHLYLVNRRGAEELVDLLRRAGVTIRERRKLQGLEAVLTGT